MWEGAWVPGLAMWSEGEPFVMNGASADDLPSRDQLLSWRNSAVRSSGRVSAAGGWTFRSGSS